MIGTTIGQYEVIAKLGGGGMGVVYTARDTKLGRLVALKFLPPQWSHDESAKQRFIREAQAASATHHPNICTIHDIASTADGQLFIVMAHYDGETLKQKLARGALPVEEALEIAAQIAEGLAKAHAQGVVHRDIKPGNLMLTEDGVRILDFGLAKFAADSLQLTIAGSTLGTVAYMSPEQAKGEEADARSDVWSLGVVLYEMLAGELPFKGTYFEAISHAIRNDPPVALSVVVPDIAPAVDAMVMRALAKDPAERIQSAREAARALRKLQGRSGPLDLRSDPLLSVGARIGPYEIEALIGANRYGAGEAYRAHDFRRDRTVVIKIYPSLHGVAPDRLARWELEVGAACRFTHPNLFTVQDVGVHEGLPFVVVEWIEGEPLSLRLDNGPIPAGKAIAYAIQIADGLGAAHASGSVHRDLRPVNVFLARDESVKLLDFGLDHGESADPRVDLFASGCVLYEMLTGRAPFPGEGPEPDFDGKVVPPHLELAIRHCLEKNPDDRFQAARDLAFHLRTLSGEAPSRPSPHQITRRRALVAIAAPLAVIGPVAAYFVGRRTTVAEPPVYTQLTFRRGFVQSARFAPDGKSVVYSAAWDGNPNRLFRTQLGRPESQQLDLPDADVLAISPSGELAIALGYFDTGTLARAPLMGGGPREILTSVSGADWAGDGETLAVAHAAGPTYRLEFPMGRVLYETTGRISDPRISPDGTSVAFIERPVRGDDRGAIAIVTQDGAKTILSDGWAGITGLAWSRSTNEVWFTGAELSANSWVYGVDLRGRRRLIATSPGRMTLHDVAPDGRLLLSESNFRYATSYRGPEEPRDRDLSWFDGSVASDLSEDGQLMLFAETGSAMGRGGYSLFARRTDGSPPVRLGEGLTGALSPDGKWAAALVTTSVPQRVTLLPIGPGEPRPLDPGSLVSYDAVTWLPDGNRVVLAGRTAGRAVRLYVQDVRSGAPKAISEEGFRIAPFSHPASPDGRTIAAIDSEDRIVLHPADGGAPQRLAGLDPGDLPIHWTADGQSLYVYRLRELPASVFRFSLTTRRKELVAQITPPDPAGVRQIRTIQMTADAQRFAYSYAPQLSYLSLVENMR